MVSIVFGATGIVGGYIVANLARAGEDTIALSRAYREDKTLRWVQGDLGAPHRLDLPPADRLFCTAEIGLLADALPVIRTPALKRIVAFTSTSIATKAQSEIRAERELVRRWAEGERRLMMACKQFGIGCTILRPTIVYAEGRDANITRLAQFIQRFGVMPLAGRGEGLRQPVFAEDLAIGAIAAMNSEVTVNKIYALPGGETISYREMVGRIFDALHKPRRILPVPPALWRAALMLAGPWVANANAAMGSRMAMDMVFDASPARQDFGWHARDFKPDFRHMAG